MPWAMYDGSCCLLRTREFQKQKCKVTSTDGGAYPEISRQPRMICHFLVVLEVYGQRKSFSLAVCYVNACWSQFAMLIP